MPYAAHHVPFIYIMPIKTILKEVSILIGIAVVAAFAVNAFSSKGIALIGDWDTSQGVISAKSKDDPVSHDLEIGDIFSVKEIYDTGEAVFIDARGYEDYAEGHVKGAVSLPAYQLEELIDEFKNKFPPYVMIITYCSGRECDDSHVLAQRLLDEGYAEVKVFIDGYPGWEEAGYPVEQNAE
jgi:rhodanese-related sulfurtransferase